MSLNQVLSPAKREGETQFDYQTRRAAGNLMASRVDMRQFYRELLDITLWF